MSFIRTVLGDIDPDELGTTLCHEHLVAHISERQILTAVDVLSDLQVLVQAGGQAVVEVTNIGMGRDVASLQQLALDTGLHIICATGYYQQSHYPDTISQMSIDDLAACFVTEIMDGVNGSDVRAGIIGEIGTSQEAVTADEAKVLRASARAALATGTPLTTHTSLGHLACQQLTILAEEGLPLNWVAIGHLDLIPEPDYHTAVAEQGAYIQYDTFGKAAYQSDEARIACLGEMVRRGFGQQILISCDISRASYLKAQGGWGYVYLLEQIVPALRRAGVDDEVLHQILVENPARFLAFKNGATENNEGREA